MYMRANLRTIFILLFLVPVGTVSLTDAQTLSNRPYGQSQNVNQNLRLHVDRAIYGKQGKGTDVTLRVKSMIRNNSLDFKVNNTNLGGDPNEGTRKTLKITYTYAGRRMSKTVNEGDQCRIP